MFSFVNKRVYDHAVHKSGEDLLAARSRNITRNSFAACSWKYKHNEKKKQSRQTKSIRNPGTNGGHYTRQVVGVCNSISARTWLRYKWTYSSVNTDSVRLGHPSIIKFLTERGNSPKLFVKRRWLYMAMLNVPNIKWSTALSSWSET